MKLAIISDIHGNLVAFEALLAQLEAEEIEHIVCLGDVGATGPQPAECLRRIRALGCPVVMGNTDERLGGSVLEQSPAEPENEDWRRFLEIDAWCQEQVTEEDREFVRTFRPTVEIDLDDGTRLLCYHGSPRSNREALLPTTPEEELAAMFRGTSATVNAGGHTHQAMVRRYEQRILLNPGSVGLPAELLPGGRHRNPPWAEYALLTVEEGQLGVELRRLHVDADAIRQAALESSMPHAAWWAADWGDSA